MAAPTEVDDPDALLSPTAGAGSCDKELRRRRKNPSRRLAVPLPEVDTFVTDGTTPTEMLVTEIASDLTSVKLLRLDSPLSLVPEPTIASAEAALASRAKNASRTRTPLVVIPLARSVAFDENAAATSASSNCTPCGSKVPVPLSVTRIFNNLSVVNSVKSRSN
ncbi:unnamed protein product [Schistosoma curassoni]|uniref:Uncharacterized protein n=1 Tax=Schistosoma curassoni TaxID=6186 RepID=A0A183K6R0_9TREM|nr:unnamed protein product [Schistosoma curassoni]